MPTLDTTLVSITTTINLVARTYKAAADKIAADFSLSQSTAYPLIMISRLGDGVRHGTLATALGMEPPSLVRLIDQLILAELVQRRDDKVDRRAKTLHLTKKGRLSAQQIEDALLPFRRELFADVSAADLQTCERVLSHLKNTLVGMTETDESQAE